MSSHIDIHPKDFTITPTVVGKYGKSVKEAQGYVTLNYGDGNTVTIHSQTPTSLRILAGQLAKFAADLEYQLWPTANDATADNRHETPLQPLEARSE